MDKDKLSVPNNYAECSKRSNQHCRGKGVSHEIGNLSHNH
jgi:hypothetical protein